MERTPALRCFSNANIIDGTTPDAREGYNVLVEGGLIKEVSDKPLKSAVRPHHRSQRQDRSCRA